MLKMQAVLAPRAYDLQEGISPVVYTLILIFTRIVYAFVASLKELFVDYVRGVLLWSLTCETKEHVALRRTFFDVLVGMSGMVPRARLRKTTAV